MSDYSEGYGQAKADILHRLNEALKLVHSEVNSAEPGFEPSEKQKAALVQKREALRWVRSLVKSIKSSR